jgi:histidinol-phosphate aminotransferase
MERDVSGITPRPGVLDIAPYVGGDVDEEGKDRVIKLSANETALGASPSAAAAFQAAAASLHRYPDGAAAKLRTAIAGRHGLDADRVVCGNGSDELISLLTRAYAGPGDEVLFSQYAFIMYRLAALTCGATPVAAIEDDYTADVDSLLAGVSAKTRLLFLANPNNPTGTYVPSQEVKRLREELRDDVLLVVDAAYAEFVSRNDYDSGRDLVDGGGNVVMLRTFSKAYGLASLRLGWAYCPEQVADVLNRIRGPYNVSMAAQAAGVAAIGDVAHIDAARTHNDVWLPWLTEKISALGLHVVPSVGNFVLVRFETDGARSAAAANDFLAGRDIYPRGMAGYGLADCLRITVGLEDENHALVDALAEFMA